MPKEPRKEQHNIGPLIFQLNGTNSLMWSWLFCFPASSTSKCQYFYYIFLRQILDKLPYRATKIEKYHLTSFGTTDDQTNHLKTDNKQ